MADQRTGKKEKHYNVRYTVTINSLRDTSILYRNQWEGNFIWFIWLVRRHYTLNEFTVVPEMINTKQICSYNILKDKCYENDIHEYIMYLQEGA